MIAIYRVELSFAVQTSRARKPIVDEQFTARAMIGTRMVVASPRSSKAVTPKTTDAQTSAPFSWPADTSSKAKLRQAQITALREQIQSWMFDHALPFWAANGVDTVNGGFVEQLTLDGRDAAATFKRTRVTARQVYVFSHARLLGWDDAGGAARSGIDFLINRTWQGTSGGFARTASRNGDVLDPTLDLYDHAFVLFAFAWRHRAEGDSLSRDWMHRTLDFIETRFRHPGGEGFWHEFPPAGYRLQNPHMHLTEGCLAAFESTGEARFAEASGRLVALFQNHLFDRATGTLREYYDDSWRPAPGEKGREVEPGHMLEWAWILNQARKLINVDTGDDIRALVAFAEQHGADPVSGATYNAVRDDGLPLDRGSRIWPNTERIKAAIALHESAGVDPWPVIAQSSQLLLSRYLGREPAGTWMDAFDAAGQQAAKVVPASSLYHLFMAFTEVLRISAPEQAAPVETPDTRNRRTI
jgi:mannose/cellobiose epimerase-like protein (N-acyl-D-glucosamine 2-epimerase family)